MNVSSLLRSRVGWGLRLALTVLPIAWISTAADWRGVLRAASSVPLVVTVLVLLTPVAVTLASTMRWRALMRAYDAEEFPMLELLRHNLVGAYFRLLPGAVAGDAVRGYRTRKAFRSASGAYQVVVLERLFGLVGLAAVALIATATQRGVPLAVTAAVGLAGVLVLLGVAANREPDAISPRSTRWASVVPGAIGWSVVTQGLSVIQVLLIMSQLAPAADLWVAGTLVPLAILLTYVPVTLGGLGQRELVFIHVLGPAGVGSEQAVVMGMLVLLSTLTLGVVGLVVTAAGSLWQRGTGERVPAAAARDLSFTWAGPR